jgi:hypothetical protein
MLAFSLDDISGEDGFPTRKTETAISGYRTPRIFESLLLSDAEDTAVFHSASTVIHPVLRV